MRWLVFAALAAWLLWRFFGTVGAWIEYPYPRGGPEGRVYHETLLIKSGTSIYDPITPDRFISGASPPLYYLPSLLVTPTDVPDFSRPDSVTSAFAAGRVLSVVAALLTAVLLVALVVFDGADRSARSKKQARLRSWAWAAPAAALFLSLPPVLVWSATLGGEMLAVALTVGGLLCVTAGVRTRSDEKLSNEQSARYPLLVAGAVLFALAFLTEQRAIAGPVASLVFLGARDRRLGLKWGALVAALIALPVLLLDLLTGHWFYLKLVDFHALPLRRINLERLVQNGFLEDLWPLVLIALFATGYFIYQAARAWRKGQTHDLPLVAVFLPVALLLLPFGVSQASDHHALLLPGMAACAALGAFFVSNPVPVVEERRGNSSRLAADGALAMVAVYAILTSTPSPIYGPDLALPTAAENEQMRAIIQYLRDDPNPSAFSDDPGIVALAGKLTSYNDPAAMTALTEKGRWDEGAYRDRLRAGELGLLALSCDATASPTNCRSQDFTPGVLASIRDGYTLLFRDIFSTYGPK